MDISKQNLLLIGFIIIAVASSWVSFKQARAVDAMGDVSSVQAEISEIKSDLSELKGEEKPDKDKVEDLIKEISELQKELPEHRAEAQSAAAAIPNGAVIWTIILQLGAIVFGISLIKMIQNSEESERIRAFALLTLGVFVIFHLLGKISSLTSGI